MKIGVFDSGIGGLIITHSLTQALPEYDYLYLGDTARVPYGNRSQAAIYQFSCQAVSYLFAQDCALVIIACNTASAEALHRIQQEYLPAHYPDRRVVGVIIPTAEAAVAMSQNKRIGVLATSGTVYSQAYQRELQKLQTEVQVFQQAAPLLVPLIENDGVRWAGPILDEYLEPLLVAQIDTLILGCTHYPYLKDLIRQKVGASVAVISQDELIPQKLEGYLARHPELASQLSRKSNYCFEVTDLAPTVTSLAQQLFGAEVELLEQSLE